MHIAKKKKNSVQFVMKFKQGVNNHETTNYWNEKDTYYK